jgi:hypothetical protein
VWGWGWARAGALTFDSFCGAAAHVGCEGCSRKWDSFPPSTTAAAAPFPVSRFQCVSTVSLPSVDEACAASSRGCCVASARMRVRVDLTCPAARPVGSTCTPTGGAWPTHPAQIVIGFRGRGRARDLTHPKRWLSLL